MVIITSHAVDRFIQRTSKDKQSVQDTFNFLRKSVHGKEKKIREALQFVRDYRLDLDGEMIAVIAMKKNKPTMVTCRLKKDITLY